MSDQKLSLFLSYSEKDKKMQEELMVHLAMLRRDESLDWNDKEVIAGLEKETVIENELRTNDIILLLVSKYYLAYLYDKDLKIAMERHEKGNALVIPIILSPSDWHDTNFSKLQVLPKDGKPLSTWDDLDEGLLSVVRQIKNAIEYFRKQKGTPKPNKDDSTESNSKSDNTSKNKEGHTTYNIQDAGIVSIGGGNVNISGQNVSGRDMVINNDNKTTNNKPPTIDKATVKKHIGSANLKKAIDTLEQLNKKKGGEKEMEVLMLSGRIHSLEKRQRLNTITHNDASIEYNKIVQSILFILDDM